MMSPLQRKLIWVLFAIVFLASATLSEVLAPGHAEYLRAGRAVRPGEHTLKEMESTPLAGTSFEALAPTLLGVREVVASIMWIRADDYFHRGEYRPIIQMIRQITLIDPHQIDVYATGAWHMAYNFMDKRLIEEGVKFLEEGTRNNDTVYDLYFELGYMHYDKTKDFIKSSGAYAEAAKRGTTTGKKRSPGYVRSQLAHAYEKMGNVDRAVAQWEDNVRDALAQIEEEGKEVDLQSGGPNLDANRHNLYITQRRRNERAARVLEREGKLAEALKLREANLALAEEWLSRVPGHENVTSDLKMARNEVERLRAGRVKPVPLAEIKLDFTVTRTAPKKLVIEGNCNTLDLSRVHIRFQDRDYAGRSARGFEYKMMNCTLEWDNTMVKKGKFKWSLDLDRDPADMGRHPAQIYPLKAEEYEISVSLIPRRQAAMIQDLYGWSGEGIRTEPAALVVGEEPVGIMHGREFPSRKARKTVVLKRADIVGEEKKVIARVD